LFKKCLEINSLCDLDKYFIAKSTIFQNKQFRLPKMQQLSQDEKSILFEPIRNSASKDQGLYDVTILETPKIQQGQQLLINARIIKILCIRLDVKASEILFHLKS